MSPPLLTEDEAAQYAENWEAVPEEEKPAIKDRLRAYADAHAGQPLFPDREAREQKFSDATEALWLADLDGRDPDAEWNRITGEAPPWKSREERDSYRRLAWLATQGGDVDEVVKGGWGPVQLRLSEKWKNQYIVGDDITFDRIIRDHVRNARDERWNIDGKPGDDEEARASQENSLVTIAERAALEGGTPIEALSKWQGIHKPRGDGYIENNWTYYTEVATQAHERVKRLVDLAAPAAATAATEVINEYDTANEIFIDPLYGLEEGDVDFAQARKGLRMQNHGFLPGHTRKTHPEGGDLDKATDAIMALPAEARPLALSFVKKRGEKHASDMDFAQATGKGVARSFENLWRKANTSDERKMLLKYRGTFHEGSEVRERDVSTEMTMESQPGSYGPNDPGLGTARFYSQEKRKLTAEEASRWNAEIERRLQRLDVKNQLINIGQLDVDPIRGGSWMRQKLWQPVADSASFLVGGMLPGAWPYMLKMTADAFREDEYQRLKGLEMSDAEAFAQAGPTAAIQAGLYQLRIAGIVEKLPFAGKALRQFAATGGTAARMSKSFAGHLSGQTMVTLTANHIVPALMQDVRNSDPKFDVTWGEVWKEVAHHAGDTALGLSLLCGHGAIARTRGDIDAIKRFSGSRAAMRMSGYSLEEIKKIQEAPMSKRGGLLVKYAPSKAPEGAAREALVKDSLSLLKEDAEKARAAKDALAAEMESAGVTIEQGMRDGQPVYRVTRGKAVTEHTRPEDAHDAVNRHLGEDFAARSRPLLNMIEALHGRTTAPVEGFLAHLGPRPSMEAWTSERQAVLDDPNAGRFKKARARADLEQMERRMKEYEAAHPGEAIDWSKITVAGEATLEVKDGILRSAIKVDKDGSPYIVLEEHSENDAKAWVRSGRTTWEDLAAMIREVEEATGDKYLHSYTGGKDAAREHAPQDITSITEAYSELVQVHATGRGRAGRPADGAVAAAAREARMTERTDRISARSRLETARRSGVAPALMERLAAAGEWLRAVVGKAVSLNRARRKAQSEGRTFTIDEFLNDSIGIRKETERLPGKGEVERTDGAESGLPASSRATPKELAEERTSFSLKPFEPSPWGAKFYRNKLAAWERGEDIGREEISLGATPPVLRVSGAEELALTMPPSLLDKVTKDVHAVPLDGMRQLPEALADPIAVFQSRTQPDALVVMTEFKEGGNPVIAAVHLHARAANALVVNRISSVYGKSRTTVTDMFSESPLYINKEKYRGWARTAGVQFPGVRISPSRQSKAATPEDVVKFAGGLHAAKTSPQSNPESAEKTPGSGPQSTGSEHDTSFALKPRPYAEAVDDALAGRLPPNAVLDLGQPGPVLLSAGVPDLPLRIRQRTVRRKSDKHSELTAEVMKGLPAALNAPMLVYSSPSDPNAHAILTSVHTSQGPVVAYFSVRTDQAGESVLDAKTVFGKKPGEILDELEKVTPSGIRYRDEKALNGWLATQVRSALEGTSHQHQQAIEGLREFFHNEEPGASGSAAPGASEAPSDQSVREGGSPEKRSDAASPPEAGSTHGDLSFSLRRYTALAADLSPEIHKWITREEPSPRAAAAVDPARLPPDSLELLHALGRLLNGHGVPAMILSASLKGGPLTPGWTRTPGSRLPAESPENGRWTGAEGHSGWLSYDPEINRLTGGRPVQFRHGFVDLAPYTILEYTFHNLTGGKSDFTQANTKLAKVLGLSSATAALEWCAAMKLTWHHHHNGKTLQLVPRRLNRNISHIGGASRQRR